jgi:hypothetical protein
MQLKFLEEDSIIRTKESYQYQCQTLEGPSAQYHSTTFGIIRKSVLHKSKYFHIVDGLVPDVMHNVLEGCLPCEVKDYGVR